MAGRAAKVTLNDIRVKNAKPGPKRRFMWDAILPNFGLQVSEHGAKSWYVVAPNRATGKQQWICLGKYPRVPLGDARKAAGDALGALETGAATGSHGEGESRAGGLRELPRVRSRVQTTGVAQSIAEYAEE